MIEGKVIGELNELIFPTLMAWALLSARFLGISALFPLFSWLNLSLLVRFAFAAAMGLPFAILIVADQQTLIKALSAWQLGILCAKEFMLGAAIGLIAGIPFWIAQSAGELIDTYRGSSAGALFDPSNTTETSELGTALIMVALAIFIWTGGLSHLVAVTYGSYGFWHPLEQLPTIQADTAIALAGSVGLLLQGVLGMSGAIILLLFAVDLALALAARSTRQFQVFELSLSIKNLGFAFIMPAMAIALTALMTRDIVKLQSLLEILRGLLP